MSDSELYVAPHLTPTATRPLLGSTILVVEDSRFASEALRLLCLRSGARIRRADCLKSARRHLQVYRPTVVIVDLGLPDGSGAELIADLARATPRVEVLLGTSGDTAMETAAIDAGADGFLPKPIVSLAAFQAAVLGLMPPDRRPRAPFVLHDDEIEPDAIALCDDLEHAADLLSAPMENAALGYVAQFLGGVARSADDEALEKAAAELSAACQHGGPLDATTARMAGLVADRLQAKRAI